MRQFPHCDMSSYVGKPGRAPRSHRAQAADARRSHPLFAERGDAAVTMNDGAAESRRDEAAALSKNERLYLASEAPVGDALLATVMDAVRGTRSVTAAFRARHYGAARSVASTNASVTPRQSARDLDSAGPLDVVPCAAQVVRPRSTHDLPQPSLGASVAARGAFK